MINKRWRDLCIRANNVKKHEKAGRKPRRYIKQGCDSLLIKRFAWVGQTIGGARVREDTGRVMMGEGEGGRGKSVGEDESGERGAIYAGEGLTEYDEE